MTSDESRAWGARVRKHGRELEKMSSEQIHELLRVLNWKDTSWLAAVHYALVHTRNLVWSYGLQVTKVRPMIEDPAILDELDFALAFDEYRLEKLDPKTEAHFRDMRHRAWEGIMRKVAEKQQREDGNAN